VAELEQAGIPRDILVSVLLADLNRRWTAQGVALQKKYAPGPVPEREQRELSRQSIAEQTRELRGALGEEGYRAWDKEQTLLALNRARPPGDELPMNAAETEQAYRLQKAFDDENRELQEAMEDGAADQADIGKLQAKAQQTLDRELERLLGKERFEALRGNSAAPDGALAQRK
jgi:ABC-type phosphate transport system auxiliary subunit